HRVESFLRMQPSDELALPGHREGAAIGDVVRAPDLVHAVETVGVAGDLDALARPHDPDLLLLPGRGPGHADDGDGEAGMGEAHPIGGARQLPRPAPARRERASEQLDTL